MLTPDQQLGPYRLIARVGKGGMGEVWRAEDSRLGRTVAIKVLPPSFVADAEATARLRREARTAAQLYHPSIATIHSIEQDGDHIFIVEEFVEGEPLTKVISRGGLSEAEICRIGRAVADALAEAHAKGIVHRDIKPDNIIVSGNRVKVLDFGIAKQVGIVGASAADTPTAAFVTQQGMILGTIHYMSPEQALGKAIDGKADVFSLGVVLYEMATGRRPFGGETITETMTQIIRDEPAEPQLVNPGISPEMNEIIRRSLRKNAAERYTAGELETALDTQMGRAATAPYASPNAVTSPAIPAATAAASTVITASQMKTVQETQQVQPAPPRSRGAMVAIIVVLVLLLAAAAAVIAAYRWISSPDRQTATTTTVAPPSTTSVSVTAPDTGTVVDAQDTAAPSSDTTSSRAGSAETTTEPAPTKDESADTATETPSELSSNESSADALYAVAMSQLASGDSVEARKTLHRVLMQDPHYAKAHFRMGEVALFNRNLNYASEELNRALGDSGRLDRREQQLAKLSLAVISHDREEIGRLSAAISEHWPDDPDLARMQETFPGMFGEFPRGRGRRRGRG